MNFTKWSEAQKLKPTDDLIQAIGRYRKEVLEPLIKNVATTRRTELEQAYYKQLREATDLLWSRTTQGTTTGKKGGLTVDDLEPEVEKGPPKAWEPVGPKSTHYGNQKYRPLLGYKDPKTEDKPMPDQPRPAGSLKLGGDAEKLLKAGYRGSVWLGFVQLARHTGAKKDILHLVPFFKQVDAHSTPDEKKLSGMSKAPKLPIPIEVAHAVVLDMVFNKKPVVAGFELDPKLWNKMQGAHFDSGAQEAGCFLGFCMVLGKPQAMPYIEFRSEINRYATARFCDAVPAKPAKLNPDQVNAWTQYKWLCRYPATMTAANDAALAAALAGAPVRRGFVAQGEKRMPHYYARAVVDLLKKTLGGR